MPKLFLFFVLICLLGGCGFFQKPPSSSSREVPVAGGVDFEGPREQERAIVEIGQGHLSGEYGPLPVLTGVTSFNETTVRQPVVAIVLGPSLNRTLAYLGFLAELKAEGVEPHILAAGEFGALLSSFWSLGLSDHRIEWEFFRLISETQNDRVYSRRWTREVTHFIKEHFSNKALESTHQKLVFPTYEWENEKVNYNVRGDLEDVLLSLFLLNKNRETSSNISFLEWRPIELKEVRDQGGDIVIYLDALSTNVQLGRTDGYVLGAYRKAAGFLGEQKAQVERDPYALYITLPMEGIALDQSQNLPGVVARGRKEARKSFSEIERVIEKWKNRDQKSNTRER